MKRMLLVASLMALVLAWGLNASAATIKATGQWAEQAAFTDNFNFDQGGNKADSDSDFNVYTRIRTQFEFIANENLKGVLATEIGTEKWGNGALEFGASAVGIEVRRAYLDFTLPGTKIRTTAGHQGLSLPYALGNGSLILDEEMASIATTMPIIDQLGLTFGYVRLMDDDSSAAGNGSFDAGFLALPVKLDGVEFTPFFMYGYAGNKAVADMTVNQGANGGQNNQRASMLYGLVSANSTTEARSAWWAGTSFKMKAFDPIVVMADFNYGSVAGGAEQNERAGYMFDIAVDYTGFDFMTPEIFFVYTSGEDGNSSKDHGKSERMPMLKASNWGFGNFFYGLEVAGMGPGGNISGGAFEPRQLGFWALGMSLKDISFIEKMKHTLTVQYIQGTNDKDYVNEASTAAAVRSFTYGRTLTEKDSLVEVDLLNSYKIYDELTAYLDLGWINNNYSKNVANTSWSGADRADAYKATVTLLYSF